MPISKLFERSEHASVPSFSVRIRVDSNEALRRLQHQFDRRSFPPQRRLSSLVAPADPDGLLWEALGGFEDDVAAAFDELQCMYVGERTYLAEGVLGVEEVFPKIRQLLKDLDKAYEARYIPEGLFLRAARLVAKVEGTRDVLEDMRTMLAKELATVATQRQLTTKESWPQKVLEWAHGGRPGVCGSRVDDGCVLTLSATTRDMLQRRYYL